MHKRALMVLLMLAIVVSMSFAGPVSGSTAAAVIGNTDEKRIEVDQEFDIDLGAFHIDVNGGVDYDLPVKEYAWDYLLGGSYAFSVFKVGASMEGDQDVKVDVIKAYVDVVYESVGADVDLLLSGDEDIFQGVEFSAFVKPGPFEIRVGYLLTEVGDGGANAPEELTDGGLYAKIKCTY